MTRAMETIQAAATKLVNIRLLSAIEACDWAAVHRLAEQLQELATRGLHRRSIETAPKVTNYREPEAR